jgi:hypothetical protein
MKFLVEELEEFIKVLLLSMLSERSGAGRSFPRSLPRHHGSRFQGCAVGHTVQPTAQGGATADGGRLPSKNQEGRLAGILGIMLVAQDTPADCKYHRAVALKQPRESVFVPPEQETLQELAICKSTAIAQKGCSANMPQNRVRVHHDSLRPLPAFYSAHPTGRASNYF